ncbi:MAG: hypothetical protein WCG36_09330, partial [bacterium]
GSNDGSFGAVVSTVSLRGDELALGKLNGDAFDDLVALNESTTAPGVDLFLEVKDHNETWSNPFYVHAFTNGIDSDTSLYGLSRRYDIAISNKFSPFYPSNTPIERVCWDGRKDTNGVGIVCTDGNGEPVFADCPENINGKKEYDVRMRLRVPGGGTNFCSSELITQTCPLPRDASGDACTGPAPYFGLFRDCVNSKYDTLFLTPVSMVPKTDGRPAPGFTTYFNGNHWWHTPMSFGWTHTYEMRVMPTRIAGNLQLYFLGPGNHLFGPADSNNNGALWIYGEKANLVRNSATNGWELTTREKTLYKFSDNGQLLSIMDRNSNTVSVTLSPYVPTNSELQIQQVSAVTGACLTLSLNYANQTRLTSATLGERSVSFNYYSATPQFATNYGPDQVLSGDNGLEYPHTFTVTNCYRRDPASRVIAGPIITQQVGSVRFNYDYGTNAEDCTTLISEAKVSKYSIGNTPWRNTTIDGNVATYDVGRIITHYYTGNKLQNISVVQGADSATYNYQYNTKGQREKQSNPQGDTTFGYDNSGNLTNSTPPAPYSPIVFHYGACNQVDKRTQGTRTTIYTLDTKGNVTATEQIGDSITQTRKWDTPRNTDGSVTSLTFTAGSVPAGFGSATYRYDDNQLGLPTLITRNGINLLDQFHDGFG